MASDEESPGSVTHTITMGYAEPVNAFRGERGPAAPPLRRARGRGEPPRQSHSTWTSFRGAGHLCLPGAKTKNRKPARQPISRELAEDLAALSSGRPPEAPLLAAEGAAIWRELKRDLRRAGIPPKTAEGRATWHSLRKSFISTLVAAGNDVKTCMTLARHTAGGHDPGRVRE